MKRRAISILVLSVAARFLWSFDANPLLLIYDVYVTRRSSSVSNGSIIVRTSGDDSGGVDDIIVSRRNFPPGSTPLDGKTIWITGASSGIGAEMALQLAYAGAGHLVLSGRRADRLESVAASCRDASAVRSRDAARGDSDDDVRGSATTKVSIVPFDMSAGPDVLDSAVSAAMDAAGPTGIDVLVLNAGRYQCSPALETSNLDDALPELMRINFESPVLLSQKVIRRDRWKERRHGHVVAISSLMGRGIAPLNGPYSATKHALRGYFYALAAEERSWLRVDVVLPGATNTGLWEGSIAIVRNNDDGSSLPKPPALHADDRSKMSVHRCARLIISAMIGPSFLFSETWITRNPGLLWVYLASYEPTSFHFIVTYVVAPLRVGMWRRHGEDALYLPTLLGHMWEQILDYYS
mmetsp:Transcript_4036/g.10235  ORF Transcript_4036/g.10235 Transcript_4036/m.10235 type:complete len:409 (-) Transcript_4036:229-1455(-)|eukprot:CAMPEP_0181082120 /NCGR_PEP_ID=MMETSP1071-20121207/3455_1 /TAXON_ID=35127 /ORGANISM="Thalassiosira sp., Strain NH16" /LENGTH=408 /DNA_ID=CAMNT_0023163691 /DNA_START=23 /DNA_END=1250 /DNA_ORIENTATION=+